MTHQQAQTLKSGDYVQYLSQRCMVARVRANGVWVYETNVRTGETKARRVSADQLQAA